MQAPKLIDQPRALPCDKAGSLLLATRKLLQRDSRTHETLARELGVPYHWLRSFIAGDIDAPSVNRIQYLYEKLSGAKLVY